MPDSGRERYRRAALRLPDHSGGGRRTGFVTALRLWLRAAVEPTPTGRPRLYAGDACRQRAYRRRAGAGPPAGGPPEP